MKIQAQLDRIKSRLDEAATEIPARIAELRKAIEDAGQVSPEVQAQLDALETSASGLANIVENPAPAPEPAPEPASEPSVEPTGEPAADTAEPSAEATAEG